jgi:gamma-glutamyltranspeptidase/glutathione hydrolase
MVALRVIAAVCCFGMLIATGISQVKPSNNGNALPVAGRSVITTQYGIVAASQPVAAAAGVQILEHGGNAVDAAIATNAVVGLMEPMMNGIGGDLFVLYYEAKSGNVYGLNASGWSPSGLTPKFLSDHGIHQMPQAGINSVTVPGVVAGWQALRDRFGTMPLSTLLEPAIAYADKGVPINEITSLIWNYFTNVSRPRAETASIRVRPQKPWCPSLKKWVER